LNFNVELTAAEILGAAKHMAGFLAATGGPLLTPATSYTDNSAAHSDPRP